MAEIRWDLIRCSVTEGRLAKGSCFIVSGMPTHRSDILGINRDIYRDRSFVATTRFTSRDAIEISLPPALMWQSRDDGFHPADNEKR